MNRKRLIINGSVLAIIVIVAVLAITQSPDTDGNPISIEDIQPGNTDKVTFYPCLHSYSFRHDRHRCAKDFKLETCLGVYFGR